MGTNDEVANPRRPKGGRQYHIGLAPGEVAPNVLLVGDPARAEMVGSLFDRRDHDRRNREYVSITGEHEGLPVTVMATGMGPDNMEIAVVELSQCVENPLLIRCGTSGGLQADLDLGDLVIARAAYRLENTSLQYVGEGYPAVADPHVTLALLEAARELGVVHQVGITATAPGFYGPQARHVPGFPPRNSDLVDDLARQGVLNLEMEISSLLTLASLRGLRAGAVCTIFANRAHGTFIRPEHKAGAERRVVDVGLRALHILAGADRS